MRSRLGLWATVSLDFILMIFQRSRELFCFPKPSGHCGETGWNVAGMEQGGPLGG